ncbi:MAG: redox-sensing transcriptional repressor Rex [Actinobacteria bacterium]|nr:redox-sensing transcriptional repressor Rex [Actinomycetota bacterium]
MGRGIPDATVARLPVYGRVLRSLAAQGTTTVSSDCLAASCGVSPAKLRKDLSCLGSYGTRGVGYDVAFLSAQIDRELGLSKPWRVVIVGVGNLGRALVSYRGFASRGFEIVGLVDAHPDVIGTKLTIGEELANGEGTIYVLPLTGLERLVEESQPQIGVIATPAEAAQGVADRLVGAGLRSILNFAPVVLSVPAGVEVRKVDLAVELQILAFHEQRRGEEPLPEAMRA